MEAANLLLVNMIIDGTMSCNDLDHGGALKQTYHRHSLCLLFEWILFLILDVSELQSLYQW